MSAHCPAKGAYARFRDDSHLRPRIIAHYVNAHARAMLLITLRMPCWRVCDTLEPAECCNVLQVAQECSENGAISPATCLYYQAYLDF